MTSNNKKFALSIAAGVAAIALIGLAVKKKSSKKKKFAAQAEEAKDNFKSKLNELQRKAKKEYKNNGGDIKDIINTAKDRANDWVNKANA